MRNVPILQSSILHLIRPQDLNHHGTMFAGQIAKWVIEAGLIAAARLIGKPEDIVCVQVNSLTFKKPLNNGDLIEINSRIAYLGTSSIIVYSEVFRNRETLAVISNIATFVTVDKENMPYGHGLKLPQEYIAMNHDIYEEALKTRRTKSV